MMKRTYSFLLNRIRNTYILKNVILGTNTVLHKTARIYNLKNSIEDLAIGSNCHIRGELLLFRHGGRITIGDYCYVGEGTRIWSAKSIKIGNRVLIAHNCNIFDNDTHPVDPVLRHNQYKNIITAGHPEKIDLMEKEIEIEDDVWIGANSSILKGVTIGKASIVAIGSVVTGDVPSFVVVAGNPARIIRKVDHEV